MRTLILLITLALFCMFRSSISDNDTLFFKREPKANDEFWKFINILYSKNNGNNEDSFHNLMSKIFQMENASKVVNKLKDDWTNFKMEFHKIYQNTEEEAKRFLIFLKNFLMVEDHNIKYRLGKSKYNMSINHLSDYTNDEYSMLLGYKNRNKINRKSEYLPVMSKILLPNMVDWRDSAVTNVKNQGMCGSCWAFSTTGSLEGQHYRKYKKLVSLSEQQLVDCSSENNGCNGGLMDMAFKYIHENGGIDIELAYPYVSGNTTKANKQCNFTKSNIGATLLSYKDITKNSEDDLKEAVALIGPISVAIDASQRSFSHYKSGVYEEENCSSTELDHGVLVVGYGTDELTNTKYWIVKNSWSPKWGEDGYIKMKRDADNMCGIASMASYPVV